GRGRWPGAHRAVLVASAHGPSQCPPGSSNSGLAPPSTTLRAAPHPQRSFTRSQRVPDALDRFWPVAAPFGLFEEFARGVVGEDLAAGLARGAVVDGVAGVRHLANGVAADRARLPGAVMDAAGPIGGRAPVAAGARLGPP